MYAGESYSGDLWQRPDGHERQQLQVWQVPRAHLLRGRQVARGNIQGVPAGEAEGGGAGKQGEELPHLLSHVCRAGPEEEGEV